MRTGLPGGLHQGNAGNSARADIHLVAHPCNGLADCILGVDKGGRILLIEGDLHQANAAVVKGLCDLGNLVFIRAPHDCDNLVLKNCLNDFLTHDMILHVVS